MARLSEAPWEAERALDGPPCVLVSKVESCSGNLWWSFAVVLLDEPEEAYNGYALGNLLV